GLCVPRFLGIRQRGGRCAFYLINIMSKNKKHFAASTPQKLPYGVTTTVDYCMSFDERCDFSCQRTSDDEEWCFYTLKMRRGDSTTAPRITETEMKSLIAMLQRLTSKR
ncbi:MAG: hypothetical protein K5685_01115, partial [Bacteroidales bacterium]|nr:hypothetical protein [Bacteroidales bacterium]